MNRKKKKTTGCLFWAVLVIILCVAAIAAWKPIEENLGSLFGGKTQAAPQVVVKPLSEGEPEMEQTKGTPPQRESTVEKENGKTPAVEPAARAVQPPQEKPVVRKTRLFFASVDSNGRILMKGVIRPIPASDSPLRDALETVLAGPNTQEVNMGLLSMIPSDSRLLGVSVRTDTAYIDFSESFRFNTLGTEGLNAQLKQIVFAATEFPTVKKVQILIEGKKVTYLAPEGIRIDAPLNRQSFRD